MEEKRSNLLPESPDCGADRMEPSDESTKRARPGRRSWIAAVCGACILLALGIAIGIFRSGQESGATAATATNGSVTTDGAGRVIQQTLGNGRTLAYEYDEAGNQVKLSIYRADGVLDSYTTYEYDEAGNLVGQSDYDGDGTVEYVRAYDSDGSLLEESKYSREGVLYWYCIYEYGEDGRLLQWYSYDGSGTLEYYSIYEYDEAGNETGSSLYAADGSLIYSEG